jgi:hypothetical protein
MNSRNSSRRIASVLFTAWLSLAAIFAQAFILTHYVHNCTHTDNCPICREIHLAQTFLCSLGLLWLGAALWAKKRSYQRHDDKIRPIFASLVTLITLKVKLSS